MFQMSDAQKVKYDQLLHSLKNAESIEETRYYFGEIQRYLDKLNKEMGSSITKEKTEEYERLRRKIIDATSKEEVIYYEDKIHDIISNLNSSSMP